MLLRAFGRALRETFDNLLPFFGLSLLWWASVLLVITAPGGTIALFRATDPFTAPDPEQSLSRRWIASVRQNLVRGWIVAFAIGIPALVLISNIARYSSSGSRFGVFTLLWMALLLLVLAAGGIACSLLATRDVPVGRALKVAVGLTLAHCLPMLPGLVLLWLFVALGGVLVIPAVMFVPPTVALTFNYLVALMLGEDLPDPLEPTAEREAELAATQPGPYSTN